MTSPAASNWPGSPGMPRPSPARPGQSPGGHSALHSPEQLKSGINVFALLDILLIYVPKIYSREEIGEFRNLLRE